MHTLNSEKKRYVCSICWAPRPSSQHPSPPQLRVCVFNLISAASTHDAQIPIPVALFRSRSAGMQVTFSIANQRATEAALMPAGKGKGKGKGAAKKWHAQKRFALTFKKYCKKEKGVREGIGSSEQRVANNKHRDLAFMHV